TCSVLDDDARSRGGSAAMKIRSTLDDCDMNNRRYLRCTPRVLVVFGAALLLPTVAAGQIPPTPTFSNPPLRPAPHAPLPQGSFLGGVPTGTSTGAVMTISVAEAIRRAREHNLGVLTGEEAVGRAQGGRWRALAELLPNVNGRVSESRQIINLAAFGFSGGPGTPFEGIPPLVGPFNVF